MQCEAIGCGWIVGSNRIKCEFVDTAIVKCVIFVQIKFIYACKVCIHVCTVGL